ncbi:Wzz/FepE/Etk N-terminal domain-containing protein [Ekhidna sp.]|uniref:Wzz/FepE/Etk N-terminal domain-containing protein n=1 Tax=Ekhidna sp. TaxID=2608089 RepID=UPI00329A3994
MNEKKNIVNEDEIDLIELAKLIWSKRIFILKVTGLFILLGLVIAFTSKVEFKASCKLLPESQEVSADLGGLGGLAGLAGFDLSGIGASGILSPELYPEIVHSVPFLNRMVSTPIYFESIDTTITSFDYFKDIDSPSLLGWMAEYTIGLPVKVKKMLFDSDQLIRQDYNLIRFSKKDWEIIEKYKNRLSVSVDSKTGTINISAEMPDPVAAAQVTDLLVKELTQRVTNYRLEKSVINLQFVQERFFEVKEEYSKKQKELARYTDRNRNITNSIIQTEYERLQNELNIAFEVYKGLATQLEQAKIKVKEETPVFTVLEPVRVPEDKSKPKRGIILIGFCIAGLFISIGLVFVKNLLNGR